MEKKYKIWIAILFLLAFLAIQFVMQSAVLAVEWAINGKIDPTAGLSATGLIIAMAACSVTTIALFVILKWAPISKQFLMTKPYGVMFWSVLASVGLIIPSMYFQEMTMPQWPDAIQQLIDQATQALSMIMSTTGGYAVVCLLAPIAEELVFRGAILRTLLEWKPERRWLMIVLSALFFALSHMNPAQFLHPFLIGLLLGWMYERTGSVLPGIIYHWINNTVAYLLFRAYQDPDTSIVDIFGSQSHALMAVGFSLLIVLPAIYQLHLRMKKARD